MVLGLAAALALVRVGPVEGQATTYLSGVVLLGNGAPVAGATVTLSGENVSLRLSTDAHGNFSFSSIEVGSYSLRASAPSGDATASVEVGSNGAHVRMTLLKTLGSVQTTAMSFTRSGGTDAALNAIALGRLPSQGSLPELLLQLPGAARGANGVVHINGDHGDINYIVDGMPIPQELNRVVGTEFDPGDISFIEILEGAYPAQYGGRFASVVNINTRAGGGTAGFEGYGRTGSFASLDSTLGWHGPVGVGSLVLNVRGQASDRFLDPPNFVAVHDAGSNTNEFLRYTLPHGQDFLNITASHSYQAFQIPNNVDNGEPANTDDNEAQDDTFLSAQYHHALRGGGSLSFGIGAKRSRIRDFADQNNDFIYGESLNLANGGSPLDCASGTVTACAFSLFSDRTARDVLANVDDFVRSARHSVRVGAFYDAAGIQKTYAITLQPGNFLAPILTPSTPDAATTVVDSAPNAGHYLAGYAQDTWQMGERWALDYGLRYDYFSIVSNEFSRRFAQLSPRMKVTRIFSPRASAYVYLGRFFTPFSLENVSPEAAHLLNLPLQPSVAEFDLRPQRDTDVEIGGHVPLGRGELGFRVMQKIAVDLIDDTQVGQTALHQDINYARGNISVQSLYYQRSLGNNGRIYLALTHARSVNKGCETQLLAPCFGSPSDWTPADHDQNWDAAGGVLVNDTRGGWFAVDGEYGSGLSTAAGCDPSILFCKVPPHTTFDVSKGIALGSSSVLTLRVRNLLNDRYRITFLNAQGNHYAAGRTLEIGWQFNQH